MNDVAAPRRPMGAVALTVWTLIAVLALGGFLALGQWQMQRRAWKLDLIEQVQSRVHATPTAMPIRAQWPHIVNNGQHYAYRRIHISGIFLHAHTTLVHASTVLGVGYWVLTPLRTDTDDLVLVNRGFVPSAQSQGAWRNTPQQRVQMTGLLRLSEPPGRFSRNNDPINGRWYTRDVAHMATSQGLDLAALAPYFVDIQADAPLAQALTLTPPKTLPEAQLPVAGLTVVSFPNNHLSYALTWYGLALMVACAIIYIAREEIRLRRQKNRLTLHRHGADATHIRSTG